VTIQLLTCVPKNPRAELQSQTLASSKAYEREMRRRILRMNISGADLEVKATKRNQAAPGVLPSIDAMYSNSGAGGRRTRGTPEAFGNDSGYE
jgi:hypothetical protein